jgi:hypothetical protein
MPRADNLRETDKGIEKRCTRCKQWLPIPDAYYLKADSADGFQRACKPCQVNVKGMRDGGRKAAVRDWLRAG